MDTFIEIVIGIVLVFIVSIFTGFFAMLLWNWLMPMIFGLTTIGYWEAWGICTLGGMIFGGSHSTSSSK